MRKHLLLFILLSTIFWTKVLAYDFALKNADDVTIYYNYINDGTELEVTFKNTDYNSYSGFVVIPEEVSYANWTRKVTSIGDRAFFNCSGLTSITIPNSVTSIGYEAFWNCSGLTSVHISNLAAWCEISFGAANSNPLFYAHHLYLNNEEIKNFVIPDGVTSIENYAFRGCSGLISVTIPGSVKSIGHGAFSGCSGLTSVTIPESVTSIGNDAFSYCSGLTSITIPNSVTSIGESAFYRCSGLTSITIPNSVTSIGESAFSSCSGLTSINVEKGNTKYDTRDNCNAIIETSSNMLIAGCKNSTIPNSVTSIENYAFRGCSGLTSITFPHSVMSIGKYAFNGCSGLTSVTISGSVTSIGEYAFNSCSGLTDVICMAETVPNTGLCVFENSNIEHATLHVPGTAIDSYKSTKPWSKFKEVVALTDQELSVEGIKKDNMTEAVRYTIGGQRTNQNTKGLNIVRVSDGTTKKVVIK